MFRFALITVVLVSGLLAKADFDPEAYRLRTVEAVRLEQPLDIDGRLDEALYRGVSYSNFVQFQPNNGGPASQKTDIWIGYDESALYVGARMWDNSPDSIVTRVGRRDDFLNTDLFEIIVDSYYDKRTGYSFQINPSGAKRDESYYNDSWTDLSWDAIWEGKTSIDGQGWCAEMRIPFSQLRFSEKDNYIWGIIPTRYLQRRDEWNYFIYIPKEESGIMSRAAELTGIHGIKPPARQSILPYVTAGASNLPTRADNPYFDGKDSQFGIGADMQFGIGGNLTVDATVNPDFGQVEVDPSQINLSAYETYYSEKRPFFVEGRNILRFGSNGPTNNMNINASNPEFFYSRRIGRAPQGYVDADSDSLDMPDVTRILGAAKLSGKLENGWSIGGLSALTDQEYAHFYSGGVEQKQLVEPLTSYNLLRARKDINEGRQGIGVVLTSVSRDFDGFGDSQSTTVESSLEEELTKQATTVGIDTWSLLGKDRDWAVGAWMGVSNVRGTAERILSLQENPQHYFQRPDADHVEIDSSLTNLTGHAGRIRLNKEHGALMANFALGWTSPGFETNDMGLTWSTDRINKHAVLGYRLLEPKSFLLAGRTDLAYANNHDFSGRVFDQVYLVMGWAQFTNYWSMNWFGAYNPETMNISQLRGGPRVLGYDARSISLGIDSDQRQNLSAGVGFDAGSGGDGSGNSSIYAYFNLKLGQRFNLEMGPNYSQNQDKTQYVTSISDEANTLMYGKRYVVATLDQEVLSANIRLNYTFTPNLTLQSYFQPFIAVGAYSEFKEFVRPESHDLLIYGAEGSTIELNEDNEYVIDPTGGVDDDAFSIGNPDFNYKALVGTLVLRWEFNPGSTLYLVWTHNGTNFEDPGDFNPSRDLRNLLQSDADDVLALKISYWFGR